MEELTNKYAILFILVLRACLAAFSLFHAKIPDAVWNERHDRSAENSKECKFVYFKKVVQSILELFPNILKVL